MNKYNWYLSKALILQYFEYKQGQLLPIETKLHKCKIYVQSIDSFKNEGAEKENI